MLPIMFAAAKVTVSKMSKLFGFARRVIEGPIRPPSINPIEKNVTRSPVEESGMLRSTDIMCEIPTTTNSAVPIIKTPKAKTNKEKGINIDNK